MVTALTFPVIAVMLLFVYRSLVTMILGLLIVPIEMFAARGIVAFLGHSGVIGLSTYATNILTLLVDCGRYRLRDLLPGPLSGRPQQRARPRNRVLQHVPGDRPRHPGLRSDRRRRGRLPDFTRNSYFQTLGIPAAIGVLVALLAALTLVPAVLMIGSRVGLLEPKRKVRTTGSRRIGTAIVRWPGRSSSCHSRLPRWA